MPQRVHMKARPYLLPLQLLLLQHRLTDLSLKARFCILMTMFHSQTTSEMRHEKTLPAAAVT